MKHISDPDLTVFNPTTVLEPQSIITLGVTQLRGIIEAMFTARKSYCGIDLKDPSSDYVLPSHAGHEVPVSTLCGDCLGRLDEARRLEGLPPLHEVAAGENSPT